jgi:hypothetical protein
MGVRAAILALVCALLPAVAAAEPECKWSWKGLGCVPSKDCKLKFKPKWGSFGPCVPRASSESCTEGAAASKPEAEAEPAKAAEPEEPASAAAPEQAPEPPADEPAPGEDEPAISEASD